MAHEHEATLERIPGTGTQRDSARVDYDLTTSIRASFASLLENASAYHGCDAWVERAQTARDLMLWAFDVLSHSPCARAMLAHAVQDGWSVALSQLADEGYTLDTDDGIIYLDDHGYDSGILGRSTFLRHMLLTSLIRALRDQWHDSFDEEINAYTPESILMRERLITAEIETFTVQVAWELRSVGHSQAWRYMIGSQDGDLAMSLARVLEHAPSSFLDGSALVHVIRQWFKTPERIAAADHRGLEFMDDVLRRRDDMCRNPFGNKNLCAEDVKTRTRLPESASYLGESAHLVLADARHYGLQNPINKAHFDHIKHDIQASVIADVPFRDPELGRRIFAH